MPQDKLYQVLRDIETDLSLMWMDDRLDRSIQEANLSMALDQQWTQNYLTADLTYQVDDLKERVAQQSRQIADLLKRSKVSPLEAEVQHWKRRALENEKLKLYPEALEDLLRAEEKDPYEFRLQSWLGRMYLRYMHDPATALTHYQKAVRYATPRSTPDAARAWLDVAHCREAMGDLPGAYEASKEAIGLEASYAPILYEHGAHCAQMEKSDTALKYLEQAIRQSPIYWEAAQDDERFESLGEAIPALLRTLLSEINDALKSLLARESGLHNVIAGWGIKAESLSPAEYNKLRGVLQGAAEALEGGSYQDRVKAVEEGNNAYRQLVQLLNDQLLQQIDAAQKRIGEAESAVGYYEKTAREASASLMGANFVLGVVGLLGLGALLVTLYWAAIQLPSESDFFFKVCTWIFFLPLAGVTLYLLYRVWIQFDKRRDLKADQEQSRGSIAESKEEIATLRKQIRVLENQHASLQPVVQELAP